MMKKRPVFTGLILLLFSLVLIALPACAGIESSRNKAPQKLELMDRFVLPFTVEKCFYDNISGTYYIMEQNRPNLYFYRNKQQINLIGGFGSDKTNFQKLSDIAQDADGNLLALDGFAKLIRKFNCDGKWIADIDLSAFNQPTRFCITAENDLIVFDAATREIKRISAFDNKAVFSFGRFQIDDVFGISSGRDYIAVVSENREKTTLFSAMGQFIREYPVQMVVDQFQNQYVYETGAVRLEGQEANLPLGWLSSEVKLFSTSGIVILVWGETVLNIKPVFTEN